MPPIPAGREQHLGEDRLLTDDRAAECIADEGGRNIGGAMPAAASASRDDRSSRYRQASDREVGRTRPIGAASDERPMLGAARVMPSSVSSAKPFAVCVPSALAAPDAQRISSPRPVTSARRIKVLREHRRREGDIENFERPSPAGSAPATARTAPWSSVLAAAPSGKPACRAKAHRHGSGLGSCVPRENTATPLAAGRRQWFLEQNVARLANCHGSLTIASRGA